ncbi:DNA-binding NarL/FixJ family response regulator [Actimicrobium sp. GrIS 1.19]|uniref:response regulator transcription factor n=1 Tax=Actimicrobium sp. GrIS 1.19 TaxID=3071708 RepID=UPI002E09AAC5|nr:DNA-binding NarL/FixJ family response regulator [Actimicrobium sp. GrIS 1.19]
MSKPATVRILLVDDHPLVRDGLRARLETIPHFEITAEASGAPDALHHAANQPFDLALMDINLAGMNGIELTAQLRRKYPSIAVLMLSMHDKPEYVMQAIEAGARGYVLKDAPAIDIIAAIDAVMSGEVYFSAAVARHMESESQQMSILTPRENGVLLSIATGKSNKHIARELNLSVRTVETHRLNIKRKLSIEGQADLIRYAIAHRQLK